MAVEFSEIGPLEKRVIDMAKKRDVVAEVCDFVEYYADRGAVEGHWRVKWPVMMVVWEVAGPPIGLLGDLLKSGSEVARTELSWQTARENFEDDTYEMQQHAKACANASRTEAAVREFLISVGKMS